MYITETPLLGGAGVGNLNYTYTDNLGSILAVTNAAGTVIARQNFDAWGRRRNAQDYSYLESNTIEIHNGLPGLSSNGLPAWLYRGYTGHEMLNEFTLINMNARLYDPVVGMMLSPDDYVQDATNTQNYNRYAYCFNNPLKYTDPSGNFIFTAATLIAAPFTGGASMTLLPMAIGADIGMWQGGSMANGTMNPFKWDYSWGYMAAGAAIGAAIGYIGGTLATSGLPMTNTLGIAYASLFSSSLTSLYTAGQTDVSVSLGVASYNFDKEEWGYLGNEDNSKMQNIGYGFGAMANVQDLVAGVNGVVINSRCRIEKSGHHSLDGYYNNSDILISNVPDPMSVDLKPLEHGLKWEAQFIDNSVDGCNFNCILNGRQTPSWNVKLNNVNGKQLLKMTNRLDRGVNLLGTGPSKYTLGYGCVNISSRALLYSGVSNVNAFLPITASLLLNAELLIRQMGIYASPYLINR